MRACYAPWDPYKLNKINPKPAVPESMPCGMVRTTESADTGLRAATDAPSSRPSTLPEAPEPPGALSCECKAVNRREWRWHGQGHGGRRGLMAGRAPSGRCSATRGRQRAIPGAFERRPPVPVCSSCLQWHQP